jgi:hypothetical protein
MRWRRSALGCFSAMIFSARTIALSRARAWRLKLTNAE